MTAAAAEEEAAAGPGPRASLRARWMRIGRDRGGDGGGGGVGGRRRAGRSAEDEAAAGRFWRGGGRRTVAATAASDQGGRARAHGEAPGRPRPVCSPDRLGPGRPCAAWRAGSPVRPAPRVAPSGGAWRSRNRGSREEAFPCAPGPGSTPRGVWSREGASRGWGPPRRGMKTGCSRALRDYDIAKDGCSPGNCRHFVVLSSFLSLSLLTKPA